MKTIIKNDLEWGYLHGPWIMCKQPCGGYLSAHKHSWDRWIHTGTWQKEMISLVNRGSDEEVLELENLIRSLHFSRG